MKESKLSNLIKKAPAKTSAQSRLAPSKKIVPPSKLNGSLDMSSDKSKSFLSQQQKNVDISSKNQSINNSNLNFTTIDGKNHELIRTTAAGDKVYTQKGSNVLVVVKKKKVLSAKQVIMLQSVWRGHRLRRRFKLKINRFTFGKAILRYTKNYNKLVLKKGTFLELRDKFALKFNARNNLDLLEKIQRKIKVRHAQKRIKKLRMQNLLNCLVATRKISFFICFRKLLLSKERNIQINKLYEENV